MSKNNPNTDEILDAIKNMMSENSSQNDQELPKDVIELTNPINEDDKIKDEKLDILELSNPIIDKKNTVIGEEKSKREENNENLISDEKLKEAVRHALHSLPSSKLDKIISDELTKIIQEKLNSSKIIISAENKKN
tara:strand:+ start:490 stop:897 length:408 start_codon:yes stop_codon:yes gene_type:complete